jgi:hypothetical protein
LKLTMKFIGIPLRRPSFTEVTAAAVMATGLWLAAVACLLGANFDMQKADAGALLLVMTWGCVSARVGIHVGQGYHHLIANLLFSALLLGLYEGVWLLAGTLM